MLFETVKKNFGFGFMQLPMDGEQVDYKQVNEMVDTFLTEGFNYFDTAHGYLDGKSEIAIRECLVKRHPRESFVLANKLSVWYYQTKEEIRPLFEKQLAACGVDYFDVYLFHCINKEIYAKHIKNDAFSVVDKLKEEGKIKHIAMSFHDSAEFLDEVLSKHPQIEYVQLQFNYLDYDDPGIQSKACYDVCLKHGKKVLVMEPVKGGNLVNLPTQAKELLSANSKDSEAVFAIRYAASFPEVEMVLSGMGNMDMVRENLSAMKGFVPFTKEEFSLANELRALIRTVRQIPCTGCRYCTEKCPKEIPIPDIFAIYNKHLAAQTSWSEAKEALIRDGGNLTQCLGCGVCEELCPQKISIRETIKLLGDSIK